MNLNYPNLDQLLNNKKQWEYEYYNNYFLEIRKEIPKKRKYDNKKYDYQKWEINSDFNNETDKLNGFSIIKLHIGSQQRQSWRNNSALQNPKIINTYQMYTGLIKDNVLAGFGKITTLDSNFIIQSVFYGSEYKVDNLSDTQTCEIIYYPDRISLTGKVTIYHRDGITLYYIGDILDNKLTGKGSIYDYKGILNSKIMLTVSAIY
mgnify:CR=1 FL=1